MLRLASDRVRSIIIQVEELRARFPALLRPVRLSQLQPVLPLLNVRLYRGPLAAEAAVIGARGAWVIGIRNDVGPRKLSRILLHELGHAVLHAQEDEPEKQLRPCLPGDPREAEAELFARLLYYGADATPEHPAIKEVVAAITAHGYRKRMPAQLPLPLPEPKTIPASKLAAGREVPPRRDDDIRRTARRFARWSTPADEDDKRLGWDKTRRCVTFQDLAGRQWFVRDYGAPAGSGGRPVPMRDYTKPGIRWRVFISLAGRRWAYTFPDTRELRDHRAHHFDRQLAKAKPLPMKQAWRTGLDGHASRRAAR